MSTLPKTLEEVAVPGSPFMLSLNALLPTGVRVRDVHGYCTTEFGKSSPVFKLCWIALSDGETLRVEGEHDLPYVLGLDDAQLQALRYGGEK